MDSNPWQARNQFHADILDVAEGIIRETDPTAEIRPGLLWGSLEARSGNYREAFAHPSERKPLTSRPWDVTVTVYGPEVSGRGSPTQVTVSGLGILESVHLDMGEYDSTAKLEATLRKHCDPKFSEESLEEEPGDESDED